MVKPLPVMEGFLALIYGGKCARVGVCKRTLTN